MDNEHELKDCNIQSEICFVGALLKSPDLIVNYSNFMRSKYDFSDPATKFFYDNAEILYQTRTQEFNRSIVSTYMAEDSERLFFYDFTPFGNYIFKKDSYIIPDKPEPQSIDFIMITYDGGEKYSYIYNRNDINTIMSYFNDIKGKVSSDYTDAMYGTKGVWIVASSKKYSGMFDLTADNRSVCQIGEDIAFANNSEKFSSNVSKIIMSYYSTSKSTEN